MSDAISRFAEQAALAIEPVERFCQLVTGLPTDGQLQVLEICSLALGCAHDIADAAADSPSPETLFRPATLPDIRKKLVALLSQQHVLPVMLLPGLFIYLRQSLTVRAGADASNAAIDRDLEWLDKLRDYKKLPRKERPAGFEDDDVVNRMIDVVRGRATTREAEREAAKVVLNRIDDDWDRCFPASYWQDWLKRMADGG